MRAVTRRQAIEESELAMRKACIVDLSTNKREEVIKPQKIDRSEWWELYENKLYGIGEILVDIRFVLRIGKLGVE